MKVVIIGGTGLIGSRLVRRLGADGHEAVPAAPSTGVNTFSGQGLPEALSGAAVTIDVSNSPSFEPTAVLDFFETSTRNILVAAKTAGVRHHVALSVVGTDRLLASGYFRAKLAQEKLIEAGPVPYSIVRATQFFEFLTGIADAATMDMTVRVSNALIQPIAADDVANEVARIAVGPPVNDVVEVAGPQRFALDELIRTGLAATGDARRVVSDPEARYFGAPLDERTLIPGSGALLASTRYDDWHR
jgi:uncharacterized protein YbjT (DUF2867 family)